MAQECLTLGGEIFFHLQSLTCLETNIKMKRFTSLLPDCSGLVSFKLHYPSTVLHGLAGCQYSMSRLEHLSLCRVKGTDIPHKSFSVLGKLKSLDLELCENEISGDLLPALARLPELTSLKFWAVGRDMVPLPYRIQINHITNLRYLSLLFEGHDDSGEWISPLGYLKGKSFLF